LLGEWFKSCNGNRQKQQGAGIFALVSVSCVCSLSYLVSLSFFSVSEIEK